MSSWIRFSSVDAERLFSADQEAGASHWTLNQWAEELSHQDSFVWGDCDSMDKDVSAYLAVRVVAGECWLMNIAVRPHLRRQGRAALLMSHLLEFAASRSLAVFLEVRSTNQGAISLYEQSGFQRLSVRPGYYAGKNGDPKVDALVMRWQPTAAQGTAAAKTQLPDT